MNWILPFTTIEQVQLDQVGGKALSLIEMTRRNLPVPPGFVLTVQFFDEWATKLQATQEWELIVGGKPEALPPAAEALQAMCQTLEFSPQQQAELDRAYAVFQEAHSGKLFAVRSSSPEEDLEGASFAGGYETSLGVTRATLQDAIRRSFASSFDARVFIYKKEHSFPVDQSHIAVIVQQQIDADTAGVAFSINPLNNCYDEAVINANYGLGESVVSGDVEPDLFIVDKIKRQIIETQVGKKETTITLNADGGTTQTARNADGRPCITTAQTLALTDLLTQIETHQNRPVDIEWAIADDKIYLLQARPITTYLPLPDEMVTPPSHPKYLYADATLIEQGVEKPLSVLGIDFVRYVLKVMSASLGSDVDSVGGGTFTAGGRYYMNLSYSIKLMGKNASLAPGSLGDESVMGILDSIDLDAYLPEKLPSELKVHMIKMPFRMIPMALPVMKAMIKPEAILQKYEKNLPDQLARFESVMDDNLSMKQQAINLTALLKFFFLDYGIPMVMAPQMAQRRNRKIFADGSGDVSDEVKALLMSLGSSLPGNKTAVMGSAMLDLALSDTIQSHDSPEVFVTKLERRSLDPGFLQAWEAFMAEFGARCPREIDVATPRPHEQPAQFFTQLKQMSLAVESGRNGRSVFAAAQAKREEAYRTLKALALQKGKRQAKAFDKNYHVLVTLGGQRETSKHYVIKAVNMFRQRALAVGEAFVRNGRFDHPTQIFNLTIDDIDRSLANPTLDLRQLAHERAAPINKIKKSHLVARIIDSRGKIFYPPHREVGEGELVGIPISPGVVRGKVKVLHNPDERTLLPGEILVTRATDPGWTPLFINAAGIILEIGGALQHGAVVAREYGLPCVSGLDNATHILQDGQLVEIDGANGIVRLIDNKDTTDNLVYPHGLHV